MQPNIIKGLPLPIGRPYKRTKLDDLIVLANSMNVGDAVEVRQSEAQTLRIILVSLGFKCITDGWRAKTRGKTLLFKC